MRVFRDADQVALWRFRGDDFAAQVRPIAFDVAPVELLRPSVDLLRQLIVFQTTIYSYKVRIQTLSQLFIIIIIN